MMAACSAAGAPAPPRRIGPGRSVRDVDPNKPDRILKLTRQVRRTNPPTFERERIRAWQIGEPELANR